MENENSPKGLLGKPKKQSGGMFDWLLKRQGAEASDKPKPKMENLDEEKLDEVSKSFKSAF